MIPSYFDISDTVEIWPEQGFMNFSRSSFLSVCKKNVSKKYNPLAAVLPKSFLKLRKLMQTPITLASM